MKAINANNGKYDGGKERARNAPVNIAKRYFFFSDNLKSNSLFSQIYGFSKVNKRNLMNLMKKKIKIGCSHELKQPIASNLLQAIYCKHIVIERYNKRNISIAKTWG